MLRRIVLPTLIALAAYAVMSGLLTPTGVILAAAAHGLAATLPQTAALFSALTGGNLVGIILCFFAFERVSLRIAMTTANALIVVGVAALWFAHVLPTAIVGLAIAGIGSGIGLSAGAVIISRIYAQQRRAMAFLGTDCAFSVAGFVFPSLAALSLARGLAWQTAYVAAAVISVLLVVAAQVLKFPASATAAHTVISVRNCHGSASLVRAGLCCLALCSYLIGQGSFLVWAPAVLAATGMDAAHAGAIVGSFWGPSIFGLLAAAVIVTRVRARALLIGAGLIATVLTSLLATTTNGATFFALTLAFGFCSTCMYKLMISVGSEQLIDAPARLITFLLTAGSLGSTLAPAVSAGVAGAYGARGALVLAAGGYAAAIVFYGVTLVLERLEPAGKRVPAS